MPDDFDSILDYCLAELDAGRLTMEGCVQRFPQHAAQLAPLLKIAARARAIPAVPALSDDKRRAIASRLPNRATPFQSRRIRTWRWPAARRIWSAVAIAVIMCVVVGAGAVAASAGSLPGDVLYPIKRAAENASLALAAAADRVGLNIELAERRLDEFSALANRGNVDIGLLDEMSSFNAQASQGINTLTGAQRDAALQRLVQLAGQQLTVLAQTREHAPAAVLPAFDRAASLAESEQRRAFDLLNANGGPLPAGARQTSSPGKDATSALSTITDTPALPTETSTAVDTPEATPTSVGRPADQATLDPGNGNPHITPPGQAKRTPGHTPPGQSNNPPNPGDGHGNDRGKPKKK